jgi:NADH:ubiquinone oxidoreductase subunit C
MMKDERLAAAPEAIYGCISFDLNRSNEDIHKTPLGEYPETISITDIWPSGNWYERKYMTCSG